MPRILKTYTLLYILFFFFPAISFSQEKYLIAYEKEGDLAFANREYEDAIKSYTIARKFFKTPLRLYYKLGESFRLTKNYDKAEYYYQKLISENDTINLSKEYPLIFIHLADVSISNGNMLSSQKILKEILSDSLLINIHNIAKQRLKSIEWTIENNKKTLGLRVENAGNNINDESSQVCNFVKDDSILFLSNIEYNIYSDGKTMLYENPLQQIYLSVFDSLSFSSAKKLSIKEINKKNRNISNISFDNYTNDAYFSLCKNLDNTQCEIYFSKYNNGQYHRAKRLTKEVNMKGYNNTNPFIYNDGKEKILYFSSNRRGGYGGYDLYYYSFSDTINRAINLGNIINTPGDEVTPFYSQKDSSLYFSSDFHKGFGGFDIFFSQGSKEKWEEVENMMQPINSPSNETFPIILQKRNGGFFTSNRQSYHSRDNKTCCNDIYTFKLEIIDTISTMDKLRNKSAFSPIFDLPISLFFHNDEPNPNSFSSQTGMSYDMCYKEYRELRNLYKAENTLHLLNDSLADSLFDSIDTFFDNDILQGLNKLNRLCEYLYITLKEGKKIDLSIRGYSSSLHSSEYNYNLSQRRIGTIRNFMLEWNDGKLSFYIINKSADDGKPYLNIRSLGLGKIGSLSPNPSSVSERRKSIYMLSAMRERKVEIRLLQIRD